MEIRQPNDNYYDYVVSQSKLNYRTAVFSRVLQAVASAVLGLLAVRFAFALLGANTNNAIAAFIYGLSEPLVAPFVGLFNVDYSYGTSTFEGFTLVAIALYSMLFAGVAHIADALRG